MIKISLSDRITLKTKLWKSLQNCFAKLSIIQKKASSRQRSRKGSKVIDIFALNEERERQTFLASQHEKQEEAEKLHLARLKMEDDAIKDKAARLRSGKPCFMRNSFMIDAPIQEYSLNGIFLHFKFTKKVVKLADF